MEKFHPLIVALFCVLVLPWFVYFMIIIWAYREWLALLIMFTAVYLAIRLLQVFEAWQKAKIGTMLARMEKEQLMSSVISEGETVVWILEGDYYKHLSAEHEQAKAFASTRLNIKEEVSKEGPESERSVAIELFKTGMDVHNIAMSTRMSPTKIIEIAKDEGLWPSARVKEGEMLLTEKANRL